MTWLDNLEESARKCIYDNRETWFETPLDEHVIESSMSSPYKPYKSGKFFIVRANVPTALDKINIKVYDENETETDPENIKENTKVLAVLEFQGIRCSVRSFQFEIELKQLLIVEPEKLFERCITGKATKSVVAKEEPEPITEGSKSERCDSPTKLPSSDNHSFDLRDSLSGASANPQTPTTSCPAVFAIPERIISTGIDHSYTSKEEPTQDNPQNT